MNRVSSQPLARALLVALALTLPAYAASAQSAESSPYPGIRSELLSGEELELFRSIAESELCPCGDGLESLDACLRREDGTCALARQAASGVLRGVVEGVSEATISLHYQRFIEVMQRPVELDVSSMPARGPEDAPVSIVVFFDFQCPFCRQTAALLERLADSYEGQVRVYAAHYPLSSHPNATDAAIASMAAHRQDAFWAYHDALFARQQNLATAMDPLPMLTALAEELGLDADRFARDFEDQRLYGLVQAHREIGREVDLTGTPAIFINGVRQPDPGDEDGLREHIERIIEETSP